MRFFIDPPLGPEEKRILAALATLALIAGYLYGRVIYG